MKVKPMSCIKFALKTMLFLGVGAGVLSVLCVKDFFSFDLPDHNSLKEYSPDLSSRVFLRDGSKLCEYAGERRYFVPVNKVPKKLINAFLSVEDKHFFEHHGIDLFGVARSVVVNLKNVGSGKRPQGASTVTQQVARIFLIKNNEISYLRKVKEAILSYRIENALSKMQILELYLNQIYLGLGSYGVAAAAKTYFNKTIDELSVAECSFLAILAKGANNYHPHRHRDKALLRRNWAINRQFEDGHITLQEKEEALRENLKTAEPDDQVGNCAEYFSEEIRKYLIEKFPFQSLNKEGLIIRTTLDVKFQQCAYNALRKGLEEVDRRFGWRGPISVINVTGSQSETLARLREIQITKGMEEFLKAVVLSCATGNCAILTETGAVGKIQNSDLKWAKKIKAGDVVHVAPTKKNDTVFSLRQLPKVQGAIVVVEADSGRVLAMQGGYSFSGSEFNRATQAKRQTGSAFKPFVYLAGLEHGFAPNSVIDASPLEVDLGGDLGVWKPKNYHGAVIDKITLRRAIERSVNTATIRIAQEVGIDKIARISEKFGVFDFMPEMLSYALGAGETTLLKLTAAYAMFANGGKRIAPTMVEYIQDKHGRIVYKMDDRTIVGYGGGKMLPKLNDVRAQILSEQSVYQLTSLLEGVMRRGSGASANFLNFPIAGKTGTSNESRDTWFVGYTPDIAVGIFVGFDEHSQTLGKNANGSNTALPIFIDFMTEAKKYLTPKPFRVPKGIKLREINGETGGVPSLDPRDNISEAFKEEDEFFTEPKIIEEKNKTAKLMEESSGQENNNGSVLGIY